MVCSSINVTFSRFLLNLLGSIMSLFLLFLLYQLIISINGKILEPTFTNTSGEYYIADDFYGQTILCNHNISANISNNCHIICSSGPLVCGNLTVIVDASDYVSITCDNSTSCSLMDITITTSNQTDLYCGSNSCPNITFTATSAAPNNISVDTINIICNGTNACSDSHIAISYTNITTISCGDMYNQTQPISSCNDLNATINSTQNVYIVDYSGIFL